MWGCSGGCRGHTAWPQCSMSWCQHCPRLKAAAGLKLRQRRSLVPGTAWYCVEGKVKTVNNNPPSANHRLMGGTGFVKLLCTGQGANQLCSPWALLVQLKDRLGGSGAAPQPQTALLKYAEQHGCCGCAGSCLGKGSNMLPATCTSITEPGKKMHFSKCWGVKLYQMSAEPCCLAQA